MYDNNNRKCNKIQKAQTVRETLGSAVNDKTIDPELYENSHILTAMRQALHGHQSHSDSTMMAAISIITGCGVSLENICFTICSSTYN